MDCSLDKNLEISLLTKELNDFILLDIIPIIVDYVYANIIFVKNINCELLYPVLKRYFQNSQLDFTNSKIYCCLNDNTYYIYYNNYRHKDKNCFMETKNFDYFKIHNMPQHVQSTNFIGIAYYKNYILFLSDRYIDILSLNDNTKHKKVLLNRSIPWRSVSYGCFVVDNKLVIIKCDKCKRFVVSIDHIFKNSIVDFNEEDYNHNYIINGIELLSSSNFYTNVVTYNRVICNYYLIFDKYYLFFDGFNNFLIYYDRRKK